MNDFGRRGWLDERGELTDLFFEENPAFEKVIADHHVRFKCEGDPPRLVEYESFTEQIARYTNQLMRGSEGNRDTLVHLGHALEWFFFTRTRDDPSLEELHEWIDGVIVDCCKELSSGQVNVEGSIWWGERQVTDRFRAYLELTDDKTDLKSYVIKLGDKRVLARPPGVARDRTLIDADPPWAIVLRGDL